MAHFAKKSNFKSIDFPHFLTNRRKSVEKMVDQKKNRGHKNVQDRRSQAQGALTSV